MEKIDLRKKWKHLYAPSSKKVEVVDVPEFPFVMVDGRIEPGMTPATSTEFQDALGALYGVSYTLKFMSKLRRERSRRFYRDGPGRPLVDGSRGI